jgi:transcriptional regulator with XRE-family HTH domain
MHLRRDSTARTRQLGDELRAKRTTAELRGTELAARLNWSPAKINKLESGERGTSDVDVALFLTHCGVTGAELDRLLALNRETGRHHWLEVIGVRFPDQPRRLVNEERRAAAITGYSCRVVPGILQSVDYMSTFARGSIEPRLQRQEWLRRNTALTATYYIDEQVLRRPLGGPAVMHDQLMGLLLTRAVVRVVPVDERAHSGIVDGEFLLLEYEDHGPVLYHDAVTANVYSEAPESVAKCFRAITELDGIALDVPDSQRLIAAEADEYGRRLAVNRGP